MMSEGASLTTSIFKKISANIFMFVTQYPHNIICTKHSLYIFDTVIKPAPLDKARDQSYLYY